MKKFSLTLFAVLLLTVSPSYAKTLDIGKPTVVTTSGATKSNLHQLIMIFSSDFEGTVNGGDVSSLAGGSLNFPATQPGDIYAAVNYTVTAGSIMIFQIQ